MATNALIKKYWPWACVALAFIIGVKIWAARPIFDDSSVLAGKYAQLLVSTHKAEIAHLALIGALDKDIVAKDGEIARLDGIINGTHIDITKKDKKIKDLETAYVLLKTCPEQLVNMTEQKNEWVGKFTLAQTEIAIWSDKYFLLSGKYDDVVKKAGEYKALWTESKDSGAACDAAYLSLQKDVKRMRFWSNTKTVVIVGVVAALAYKLISK